MKIRHDFARVAASASEWLRFNNVRSVAASASEWLRFNYVRSVAASASEWLRFNYVRSVAASASEWLQFNYVQSVAASASEWLQLPATESSSRARRGSSRCHFKAWWLVLPLLALDHSLALAATRQNHPLVIAHRGASGYLPEHTLEAKAMAHALGADYIEQDLVLTKDDVPVVLHDIHIDTVTDVARRFPDRKRADGRYYALDFTLAELKQLRVSERFNAKTGVRVYAKRFPSHVTPSSFQIATLEEELQLIEGLNRSTGRVAGIYPELKQPKWHREQGRDLAKVVLPILARHGYATKEHPCFLQCFELTEIRRLREELGWRGNLVMLIEGGASGADGTDYNRMCTAEGLKELSAVADGIGPAMARIVTWSSDGACKVSELVKLAHAAGLVVHPYTVRTDDLPKNCRTVDELHHALFSEAQVDGVFTDFTDVTAAWVKLAPAGRR